MLVTSSPLAKALLHTAEPSTKLGVNLIEFWSKALYPPKKPLPPTTTMDFLSAVVVIVRGGPKRMKRGLRDLKVRQTPPSQPSTFPPHQRKLNEL